MLLIIVMNADGRKVKMTDAEKYLKANALVAKMYSIYSTVEGMRAFNQSRVMRDESIGYSEVDFFRESEKLDALSANFHALVDL